MTEPQLTLDEALSVRDEAIARVDLNADSEWKIAARTSLQECAFVHTTFTADEVWERLEQIFPDVETHEPSAMGPIFLAAARRGWIEKVRGEFRKSKYGRRHRDLQVWRSRL